jgi:hypothetical protein
LHVLQGADASVAANPATLVQSASGTAFDGVLVNNVVVLFPRDATQPVATFSFVDPAGARTHVIAGLQPSAGYTVVRSGNQVTVQAGGTQQTDSGGVLSF